MGKLLQLDPVTLSNSANERSSLSIVRGLSRGEVGFILAAPDTGKGYLCLSMCYELASELSLVGLKTTKQPIKTLYWPKEDGFAAVAQRISDHFLNFSTKNTNEILKNFKIWQSEQYISEDKTDTIAYKELNDLIATAKDFDILFIDTLRECVGPKDEVKDDKLIKLILQKIAKEADIAIIACHHITKDAAKGKEPISSVSGSGLSETLANSRMLIHIEKVIKNNKESTLISHIKHNYIAKEDVLRSKICTWSDNNLLTLKSSSLVNSKKAIERQVIEEVEPSEINMDSVTLSHSSMLIMEEQAELTNPLSDVDLMEHKKFIDSQN
ncbi:AAA family ATPase (plasmid) [Psychrobium sp. nBUS_13]|uniref:AAA family ATPase n=1 Tax=Psychrobium sp. nBUS_13 TaxID=3395319 RepID=UPI003EBE28C8